MNDLSDRYGRVKMATVQRDFNALRQAIRAHDAEAAEVAWEQCERWIGFWPREKGAEAYTFYFRNLYQNIK